MIIQELKAEFSEYFASSNAELILWLDREKQWRGVIEHLKDDFRVEHWYQFSIVSYNI